MTLSLIIPVYNEIDQLKFTIQKLLKLRKKIKKIKFIFIDDFSTDESFNFLKKKSKKIKCIKIFRNKKKGLGSAIEEGIKKSQSKYICIFMCDLSDNINDVEIYTTK